MKMTRRILSWVLAISLVITCGITGLVLPVGAESAEAVDLINGQGTFEDGTTPGSTALSDLTSGGKAYATIVDDPDGSGDNKVLQIGKFVDENADGVNDGTYAHTSYPKWKKLYDAETGKYDKRMTAGKCYTLKMDVYGDGVGLYFQADYHVLSHNAVDTVGDENGWFQLGNGAKEWNTYTFVFYADDDIATTYHSDWWSWGMSFSKTASSSCQPGKGYTYIDNVQLYETQATSITIDSEDIVLEPGDATEALAVTVDPVRSNVADVVWSSDAEGVAKVDATTGVITAVAEGTATITATAGALTDTIKVTVQKDKTQSWADLSKATYDTGANKDANVTVNVDSETGMEYISVSESAHVRIPNWAGNIGKDQWVGLSFLTRVTDGANNAGSVRAGVKMQNIVEGYVQPEWYARTAAMGGDWERVTFYAKTNYASNYPYFQFITLDKPSDAAATYSYDIADVNVFLPDADNMNLFGQGADFEDGYAPVTLGDSYQAQLLVKSGVAIVDDPTGADNKVFYVSTDAAATNAGTYWYGATRAYHDEAGVRQAGKVFENGKMYKISFRAYCENNSNVTIDSYGGASYKGTINTRTPGQWRTVTTYMYTTSSFNSTYALHVRFGDGPYYIDDLEMYECGNATGFEIKGDAEMIIGESQTLEIVPVPKHAYPGTVTLSLADDATGLGISGKTVTAKAVTGVTVTGGDVIATSDVTDGEGNPISSSFNIKVDYPKVILDEDFESDEPTIFKGKGGGTISHTDVDSYSGNKAGLMAAPAGKQNCWYFYKSSYVFKPNSFYRFTVKVKGAEAGKLINNISINKANINDVTFTQQAYTLGDQWVTYTAWIKTGAAPALTNSNYGFGLLANKYSTADTSFYVDDMKIELVDAGDELFSDGNFDTGDVIWNTNSYMAFEAGAGRDGSFALAFTPSTKRTAEVIENIPCLEPYSMYELTYWTKVSDDYTAKTQIYWGPDAKVMPSYNATLKTTTEWAENKLTFFTNARTNLAGNCVHFDVKTAGEGKIYVDDVSLKKVDTNFINIVNGSASAPITVSIDGGATYKGGFITDVPAGTVVKVKTWHSDGFILSPGSYTFTNSDGTKKVLNKDIVNGYTEENFGKGTGEVFEFIMPEKSGQLYGTSLKKTDQSFLMDTVATSLRMTGVEDEYDGIRFLTRLALKTKFDPTVEGLTVTYGGAEYTVLEFGSLLKRYEEVEGVEVELTLDTAKWTSPAYVKDSDNLSTMKLLDYTSNNEGSMTNYLDFTSVMKKGEKVEQTDFEARTYTARGYMILDTDADGVYTEGVDQVIYSTNQVSDSVDSVQARL